MSSENKTGRLTKTPKLSLHCLWIDRQIDRTNQNMKKEIKINRPN